MYRTLIDYHNRINRGEKPVPYIIIQTDLGLRGYAKKTLKKIYALGANMADGSVTMDGSVKAGSGSNLIEISGRILNFGKLERVIQPRTSGLLLAYSNKKQQTLSVTLNNADRHFSRILGKEPFLTKTMMMYLGFESISFYQHQKLFEGEISEIKLTTDKMIVEAREQ